MKKLPQKSRKVWTFSPVTRIVPSTKRYNRRKLKIDLYKSLRD